MARLTRLLIMSSLIATPASLIAGKGASGFNLVNNTGQTIFNLYIRRTGTSGWQPLSATPPKPVKGMKATLSFADRDCAFDLKVTLEDKSEPVWGGVNLCEVKLLILNRNEAGVTWADYD